MKKILFLTLVLIPFFINAQITDDFEDGNIDGWTESVTGHWAASTDSPITGTNSLHQIFDETITGNYHDQISHPFGAIDISAGTVTWRFQVKYTYDPSGDNTWAAFLFADADALQMYPTGAINGYAFGVNFSGTTDLIKLWKVTSGSASQILNTDYNWQTNITTAGVAGFEITRTTTGDWSVFIDADGGFDNLVQIGTTINNTDFTTASYFGICNEYIKSADQSLWIDDISLSGSIGDNADSQLTAGASVEPTTISSLVDTQLEASIALDFNFADQASGDTKPTIIDQIKITQGALNEIVDWTNAIAGAILTGNDISGELIGTVNDNNITFANDNFISIADGTNETYTLKVWLKTDLSTISDNDNLDFKLSYSDITCDANGSSFGSGSIESGTESISINATKLSFGNISQIVGLNSDFTVSISATDENNNVDIDYNSPVSLYKESGIGNLSSISGLTKNANLGIVNWADLQYDTEENFSISASSGSLPTITSANIQCLNIVYLLDDNFEDGDIAGWEVSTSGTWASSTLSPINETHSLHHVYDNLSSSTDQISYSLGAVDLNAKPTTWRFQLRYENPAPSGNNNWSVFLISDKDNSEMTPSGNINGYALGLNFTSSDDIIKLFKLEDGAETEIINTNFDWNTTNSDLAKGFEITRETNGNWEVKIDDDGGFDNLVSYGTTNDATFSTLNYFGIYYKYSSTLDQKLWLDDIAIIGPPDSEAPLVVSVKAISPQNLKIEFNENIELASGETTSNYSVNNSIGSPNTATLDATNHKIINLQFTNNFADNQQNELTINNVEDESGNVILSTEKTFVWKNINAISVSALTDSTLDILFTKEVNASTATSLTNYFVDGLIANPETAALDVSNNKLVHLKFANNFTQEQSYIINIKNVTDVYGNVMVTKDLNFIYYKANPYDIVINEIMPDVNPAPPALPVYEYIEIYNNSDFDINLRNWTITIGTKEHVFPDSIIHANGFAILCEEQAVSDFSSLGMVLGIMDNSELTITGRRLVLKDNDGNTIEDITYSPDWHTNDDYSSGGFSLERIDPTNLCGENQNWATTANIPMGGTPGSLNSVYASNPDISKPTVISVEYISSKELKVYFSEKLDKTIAETVTNYSIGNTNPISANVSPETTSIINLTFADNFNIGSNTLIIENVEDNCGNIIESYSYNFDYQLLYPKTIEVISENQLRLHFSEKVDLNSAQTNTNYTVNGGVGNAAASLINNNDSTTVTLLFNNSFTLEQLYTLTVSNVKDVNNNVMETKDIDFIYYIAKPFDIVINEIMCDINPAPIAVPEAFYVELYNTSDFDIDLTDWYFISEGQTERNFPYITLKSHEFLILCETDEADLFSTYDNVLPLLASTDIIGSGRNLKLFSSQHTLIEEVDYSTDWYHDEDKDNGGWSLERIDPTNFCGEANNWKACENAYGGTPGTKNSVFTSNQDNIAPEIIDVDVVSSNYLLLHFSENINIATANNILNYTVDNGINNPNSAVIDYENKQNINLYFSTQFISGQTYLLQIENISDNCDNTIQMVTYEFVYNLISPINLWVKDDKHIKVQFSETADLQSCTNINNYIVDNGVGNPTYVARETDDTSVVYLEFDDSFPNGEDLILTISGVKDVNDNIMEDAEMPFSFYIPKLNDIVINELLFHPNSGGSEFVEFYNRSDKRIDLVNLKFATWNNDEDIIKSIIDLSETNMYFEPKTYLAFAKNKEGVLTFYMSKNSDNIIELPDFPSLDNKGGKVLLMHGDSTVIDEFTYSESMHFQLLDSETGVSLERINFDRPTQDENNWFSASEYVGFATPAYENSQYSEDIGQAGEDVFVEPYMFSPDNDGIDDFAQINYKFDKPGNVATVIIFDAKGRQVKQIANNLLLSTEGTLIWNGLYKDETLAPRGTYLIYFKVFDLDGNVKEFKVPVVSARRF